MINLINSLISRICLIYWYSRSEYNWNMSVYIQFWSQAIIIFIDASGLYKLDMTKYPANLCNNCGSGSKKDNCCKCGKWMGNNKIPACLCNNCGSGSKKDNCCKCGKWMGSNKIPVCFCNNCGFGSKKDSCCKCNKWIPWFLKPLIH